MNILEKISEKTKERVNKLKLIENELKEKAYKRNKSCFEFEKALKKNDIAFICEIKKASPSKGIIAENFPYIDIAEEYEKAGADAISVLTEPFFFLGDIKYAEEVAKKVKIPVLRKDFIIDEVMIYEAAAAGVSAILLICAILDDERLKKYISVADDLGLSCLVEAHDDTEIIRALKAGARVIGVNNRDLKTFNVDIKNSLRYRNLVPDDVIFVSESGIKTNEQIEELRKNNVNAVLIGETFMKSKDKNLEIKKLKGGI